MQLEIMELIYGYFGYAKSVIYVINQLNALPYLEVNSLELRGRNG